MRRFLAICCILFSVTVAHAAGLATNPADLEEQACATLATLPERYALEDVADAPLDASAQKYLADRAAVVDMLRQAAKLNPAVWPAVDPDLKPTLSRLSHGREALNLLRLRARADAAAGRPLEAVDDLLTAMTLGRHAGQQPLLVTHLVAVGYEGAAIDSLAAMLPSLPNDVVAGLPPKLAALPAGATLSDVIEGEHRLALQIGPAVVTSGDAEVVGLPSTGPTTSPALTAAPEGLVRSLLIGAEPVYAAARSGAALPPDEFARRVESAASTLRLNPIAKTLAHDLKDARVPSAVLEAKRSLLSAAIAYRIGGAAAAAKLADPFGSGPFRIVEEGGGVTLTSALRAAPKLAPVSLRVGPSVETE